jgi:type IX secretion system PorP/SprF family membrane protein
MNYMKNKYNKIASFVLGIIAIVVSSSQLEAQQDSQYTQYMYNTQTVNPAYAGTRGVFGVTALYRNQWVGLEGAPETLNFSLSTPLGVSERLGIGLSFIQDKAGPASESTIVVDVSYTIPVGERTSLSFGIKGGVNLLNVDYSLLNIFNPNDALQQFNIDNRMSAVAGAGLYLHDVDKWYVGLSVPNFLETTYYDDTSVSNASEKANVYAIAGYVFNVNETTKFKPAVLGKFITGAPIGLDLSANFLFNEKVTLGAAYRLDAAVSALAGFQVSDTLLIGYSYDYGTQELANFNSGSHEIFLRFELGRNRNDRFLSPRFF